MPDDISLDPRATAIRSERVDQMIIEKTITFYHTPRRVLSCENTDIEVMDARKAVREGMLDGWRDLPGLAAPDESFVTQGPY